MSVVRVGSNQKYSDNWDGIFSGQRTKKSSKKSSKRSSKKSSAVKTTQKKAAKSTKKRTAVSKEKTTKKKPGIHIGSCVVTTRPIKLRRIFIHHELSPHQCIHQYRFIVSLSFQEPPLRARAPKSVTRG